MDGRKGTSAGGHERITEISVGHLSAKRKETSKGIRSKPRHLTSSDGGGGSKTGQTTKPGNHSQSGKPPTKRKMHGTWCMLTIKISGTCQN